MKNNKCERNYWCNCDGSCRIAGRNHQQYGMGRDIPESCSLFVKGDKLTWVGWVALAIAGACLGGEVVLGILLS